VRPLLALLLCASAASAEPLSPVYAGLTRHLAAAKAPARKVFPLALRPAVPAQTPLLLDVPLAELRDAPLSAVSVEADGRTWSLGIVTDADYDEFFVVLRSGAETIVSPLAPLGRFLERGGVLVEGEDGPLLRLNARISLLHPINGSSIVAVDAEDGSRDAFTIGRLVEALKLRGRAVRAGEHVYHLFVLPVAANGALSAERHVFLIRIAGTRTRGYAVREDALEPGRTYGVTVGETALTLLKTGDGRLVIRSAD
jgi:hypothetical protein